MERVFIEHIATGAPQATFQAICWKYHRLSRLQVPAGLVNVDLMIVDDT